MVPEILDWAVYGSYPILRASRTTLDRFGILGDLIELPGEAGWNIIPYRMIPYRMIKDEMYPTSVSFACGDEWLRDGQRSCLTNRPTLQNQTTLAQIASILTALPA
jgi:hypothetical protein